MRTLRFDVQTGCDEIIARTVANISRPNVVTPHRARVMRTN